MNRFNHDQMTAFGQKECHYPPTQQKDAHMRSCYSKIEKNEFMTSRKEILPR